MAIKWIKGVFRYFVLLKQLNFQWRIIYGFLFYSVELTTHTYDQLFVSVPHVESEEEIEISTDKIKWPCKRKRDFDYVLPNDKYSSIHEDKLDVRGKEKRKIIALSDLHLGGAWSNGMDWKLEQYLDKVIATAKEEVRQQIVKDIITYNKYAIQHFGI